MLSAAKARSNHPGCPRPLSPLRVALAAAVVELVRFNSQYGLGNGLDALYRQARWRGLSRAQVNRALEDLAAAGEVTISARYGGVEVWLAEAEEGRIRA